MADACCGLAGFDWRTTLVESCMFAVSGATCKRMSDTCIQLLQSLAPAVQPGKAAESS